MTRYIPPIGDGGSASIEGHRDIKGWGSLAWKPIALAAVLFLGGCGLTPQGDIVRGAVKAKGAKVSAQALDNAVWVKCRAASGGAITDRYMVNDQTWKTWTDECLGAGAIALPEAE